MSLNRRKSFPYWREPMEARSDGGEIPLDWWWDADDGPARWAGGTGRVPSLPADAPIIIGVAGVTGTSQSPYMMDLASWCGRIGWRLVVMNMPGVHPDHRVTTPRFFSGYDTRDYIQVIELVRNRYPKAPLFAVAYSMGAQMAIRALAELGDQCPFTAAVSISNPWELREAHATTEQWGMGRWFYDPFFASKFRGMYLRNREVFRDVPGIDEAGIMAARGMRAFDAALTVHLPYVAVSSVEELYRRCSAGPALRSVQIPVLSLNAADDPVVPPSTWPIFEECDNVLGVITATGGHLGWLEGTDPRGVPWSERVAMGFFQFMLAELHDETPSEGKRPRRRRKGASPARRRAATRSR